MIVLFFIFPNQHLSGPQQHELVLVQPGSNEKLFVITTQPTTVSTQGVVVDSQADSDNSQAYFNHEQSNNEMNVDKLHT